MIKIEKSFDIASTLKSGQCFRATSNGLKYITILKDRVLKISETNDYYEVYSNNEDNLKEIVYEYFDLNRDYKKINECILKSDKELSTVIVEGHRILCQDPLEMFISYIISQNNNVKRISYSVNKLCELYGRKIIYDNDIYYLFPTLEKLLTLKIEDLSELKIGFRDKYIMNALDKLRSDNLFLEKIKNMDTKLAMEELIKIKGIGPKVASCILMFGFKRFDAYPIDTWVKKYLCTRFEVKNIKELHKVLYEKYGEYVGLAVQYMFNYERNIKVNF